MSKSFSIQQQYKVAIGLFSALFIGSAIFGMSDIQASYDEYHYLEFPGWLLYPLSVAKVLGIYAILKSKSQRLKDFAYAGFLYDLLCALGGHIAQHDIKVWLPIVSLLLWYWAFDVDKKYHDLIAEKAA